MTDEIDIPASALEPKPWFPERPGDEIRLEILQFIRDGGQTFMWRGHTHTRPPPDAFPVYLGEFDIPGAKDRSDLRSPCPCCSPRHAKYFRAGKIAWFPDEQMIRLLGPDCFSALNPEGHDVAVEAMRSETRRRLDTAFLEANAHHVSRAATACAAALPLAQAMDGFGKRLRAHAVIRRLASQTRNGMLQITVTAPETTVGADGQTRTRDVDRLQDYATVDGRRLIDAGEPTLAPRLEEAEGRLRSVAGRGDFKALADDVRKKAVRELTTGMTGAQKVLDELADARRFLRLENLATIRTWGQNPTGLFRIFLRRDGPWLLIGANTDNAEVLEIPVKAFDDPLPVLPRIVAGTAH